MSDIKNKSELEVIAQDVAQYDDVEIVAQVDVDNQVVVDAVVIKDSQNDQDQHHAEAAEVQASKSEAEVTQTSSEMTASEPEDENASWSDESEDKTQVQGFIDLSKQKLVEELESVKESATNGMMGATDELLAKAKSLDEQYGIEDKILQAKDAALTSAEDLKQKVLQLKVDAKENLDQAKQIFSENQQTSKGGLSAKLGNLGAYLSAFAKSDQKTYQAVDVKQDHLADDAFHQQGAYLFKQLTGSKGAMAQNLATKVVEPSKLEAWGESIYQKVAQWAERWALKDLQQDKRFEHLSDLGNDERHNWLDEIANQNRALAVLGGVSGLMGLKGVIIDTAWLLLVSLKSVYQIAVVSGQPLSGSAGIKQAYGILGGANLAGLQQKQILMTALALGENILSNAQETGLKSQLVRFGERFQEGQIYTKQLDDLNRFVDLDKLNSKWLQKILPLGSVALSAYYNHQLIEEVLGTAIATFAKPQPLLADKTSQNDQND